MSLLANIFGIGEEEERGRRLDAELERLNRELYGPGGRLYTPERWQIVQEHMRQGRTADVETSLVSAAAGGALAWLTDPARAWQLTQEGAQILGEAAGKVVRGGFDIVETIIKPVLKKIPWWVWALLAVWIGIKTGFFNWLFSRLRQQ